MIRAVKIDVNYAAAWTNLGAVYFILGFQAFANQMFEAGIRAEPEYIGSWVGQALVAEYFKREEMLGLFRHSTSLLFHREAALGYAQHILHTVQHPKRNDKYYRFAIERMHAVPVATDCMQWYTGRRIHYRMATTTDIVAISKNLEMYLQIMRGGRPPLMLQMRSKVLSL